MTKLLRTALLAVLGLTIGVVVMIDKERYSMERVHILEYPVMTAFPIQEEQLNESLKTYPLTEDKLASILKSGQH